MFGFLTPTALAGLGLLVVPIVLHLFKPRKVRQTPFSSLRWLRASQHRMSRRIRWHQVLLLMLRLALLGLLVLAIAKPIISLHRGARKTDRFVILDVSGSMAFQPQDEPVPIDLARKACESLIQDVMAGDRTAVILSGASAKSLGPMVGDASPYLTEVRAARPESSGTDFGEAVRLARTVAGWDRSDAALDLYFVTDNQARNWSQGAVQELVGDSRRPVRAHVIDVGPRLMENVWISEARLLRPGGDESSIRVEVAATTYEAQTRRVVLSGLPGVPEQAREVRIEPAATAAAGFALPADYDVRGKVAQLRLEPSDGLPGDDVYWLNLDASGALKVLIVEPESTQIEELRSAFHLRSALEALAFAFPGTMDVRRMPAGDLLAAAIRESDLVILADVPTLGEGDVQALQERVAAGAGLAVFLGPGVDAGFYNTRLHDPLHPAQSLLPAPLGERVREQAGQAGLPRLSRVESAHPLFQGLLDPVYGDLMQAQFESYYRMGAAPPEMGGRVLACIRGDVPALIERPLGAGRVLVLNTTANDAWGDLPRRQSFVPLLDRLLDYLGGGQRRGMFKTGHLVSLTVPGVGANVSVSVRSPTGRKIEPALRMVGGRLTAQIESPAEAGIYRLEWAGPEGTLGFPFVVQPDRGESMLGRAKDDVLRAWWAPAQFERIGPDPVTGQIRLPGDRVLLDPWLIVAACLVFLAEMFCVHWLCPRMNPVAVSRSIVGQHGFFGKGAGVEPGGGGTAAPAPAAKAGSA